MSGFTQAVRILCANPVRHRATAIRLLRCSGTRKRLPRWMGSGVFVAAWGTIVELCAWDILCRGNGPMLRPRSRPRALSGASQHSPRVIIPGCAPGRFVSKFAAGSSAFGRKRQSTQSQLTDDG